MRLGTLGVSGARVAVAAGAGVGRLRRVEAGSRSGAAGWGGRARYKEGKHGGGGLRRRRSGDHEGGSRTVTGAPSSYRRGAGGCRAPRSSVGAARLPGPGQ